MDQAEALAEVALLEAKVAPPVDKVRDDLAALAQFEMAKAARSAVPEDKKAYGAISFRAAIGDDAFISGFLDNAQRSLCGDPATGAPGIIVKTPNALAQDSAHAASAAIRYSFATEGGLHPQHAPPLEDSPSGGGSRRGAPEGVLQVVRI